MSTYFETVSKSYVDVPVSDAGVDTLAFLEATEGLIKMFDLLGNSAFAIVQNDMNGNVTKIRNRYLATPTQSATLEQLVDNEKGEKKRTATEGLLWLLRGLKFTQVALARSQADKKEELADSFTKAYEQTLKKYHSFVVKPLFTVSPTSVHSSLPRLYKGCSLRARGMIEHERRTNTRREQQLAMKACPYRKDFYAKLGPPEAPVDSELSKWNAALSDIIARLEAFYEKTNAAKGM
ncbi:SPOSA6832_01424, partial [Sporobolomyces salmonicolor]